MLQHRKANRKRFALARTTNVKAKNPTPDENTAGTSDPIWVGLIQKDDHFLRIKPISWKSAECDIEIWGIPYNGIIDSGAVVLDISLRVVERAGRRNDLIMLTEKEQLVSADKKNIKTVGQMINVAFRLGKVHGLGDVVVLDVNTYDVLFGLPALVALRANLDFERRSIILRNTGGKTYAVPMRLTLHTTINVVPRVSPMMAGALRMITRENSTDDEPSSKDADNSDENDPAWRTDVEGDLLGFLFGSVRSSHRQPIVLELTVPLVQLADDLPLEIVSQSDESPVPHVLTRTLAPYLQCSACLEKPGNDRNPPSQRDYLSPREIIDPSYFQDRTATKDEVIAVEEEEEEEEDDEEETPEEGSYSEHSEGEQSEEEEEEEQDDEEEELELEELERDVSAEEGEQAGAEAEDLEAARKTEEIAAEKQQQEFASGANQQVADDPARDPEPPKPEDGDPAAETSTAPTRRPRSRSPSPSTPDRPPVRARIDAGHRASSPVVIPPSP
ncbi:hypothetical protein CBR_g3413 [Chara braunii]|uniref:Aspartic peptidase DDI1-type domain-containing protein n=1 Tax=Chara braunii TaxID=69332 RepID=A0A388JQR8_CHABU|nr:hypothetical protein CBR_g3413 [Chara braunii]|eukprot:GBG60169.1 hypothetical protein CBR_g3413 [Chara braunii]